MSSSCRSNSFNERNFNQNSSLFKILKVSRLSDLIRACIYKCIYKKQQHYYYDYLNNNSAK